MMADKVLLCLSGGPDSAAIARQYVESGAKVTFVHLILREVNEYVSIQHVAAARVAAYFRLPLYTVFTRIRGLYGSAKEYVEAGGNDDDDMTEETALAEALSPFIDPDTTVITVARCYEDDYAMSWTSDLWDLSTRKVARLIPNAIEPEFHTKREVFEACGPELWGLTWSCFYPRVSHRGEYIPCGKCGKCLSRASVEAEIR